MTIEEWWGEVKGSEAWSGAYRGLSWNELWDAAREELKTIYYFARMGR